MPESLAQRERILDAAADELAARGFGNARLRDIAQSAGVSIGLVQHYFDSRDTLLFEAFEWSIENLLTQWRHQVEANGNEWARLQSLIDVLTSDSRLTRRATTWIEFCVSASRHPELRNGVRRVYTTWRELLHRLIEEGTIQGVFTPRLPVDRAVEVISAAVDGCDLAAATAAGVMTPEQHQFVLRDIARITLGVNQSRR